LPAPAPATCWAVDWSPGPFSLGRSGRPGGRDRPQRVHEGLHLRLRSHGDTEPVRQRRELPSHEDAALAERLDERLDVAADVDHEEVRVRRDVAAAVSLALAAEAVARL